MNYTSNHIISERGVRKKHKNPMCPHDMAFPAMISALKTFMGLPPRIGKLQAHGRTWENDLDYFFQMGVSGEGFGLLFDLPHGILKAGLWNGEPLKDCFNAEGIKYRLVMNTVKTEELVEHINNDLPMIFLYNDNKYLLVMGYEENGQKVRAYPFSKGNSCKAFDMMKNSRIYDNWTDDLFAVVFIDGLEEPRSRREIVIRALERGYQMLISNGKNTYDYGFGEYMWDTWISRIENDDNYRRKKDKMRYINPEKFDLAERRCYTAAFFTECEEYLSKNSLQEAVSAFSQIHDKMWEVHFLVTGDNDSKLLDHETRMKIVSILEYCRKLDLKAAENIGHVIGKL
ncbi:MAG: hypothetical protein VB118_09830 [Oscillospiraceae bacterium]|nr:hypothetical protein [Oscillospiraceae bacterium]